MKKLTLLVEVELEDFVFDGASQEEIEWFNNAVLGDKENLLLHSNEIGDTVGKVKVLYRVPERKGALE